MPRKVADHRLIVFMVYRLQSPPSEIACRHI